MKSYTFILLIFLMITTCLAKDTEKRTFIKEAHLVFTFNKGQLRVTCEDGYALNPEIFEHKYIEGSKLNGLPKTAWFKCLRP